MVGKPDQSGVQVGRNIAIEPVNVRNGITIISNISQAIDELVSVIFDAHTWPTHRKTHRIDYINGAAVLALSQECASNNPVSWQ